VTTDADIASHLSDLERGNLKVKDWSLPKIQGVQNDFVDFLKTQSIMDLRERYMLAKAREAPLPLQVRRSVKISEAQDLIQTLSENTYSLRQVLKAKEVEL
jgi:hypothetical protein